MVLSQTKAAKYLRTYASLRREKGLCPRCGAKPENGKTCNKCRAYSKAHKSTRKDAISIRDKVYRQRNWAQKKVWLSKQSDRKKNRPVEVENYITAEDVLAMREHQNNLCVYCKTPLQTDNMKTDDGLTIERIDNSQAHVKGNCALACWGCNTMQVGDLSVFRPETQERKTAWLEKRKTEKAVRAVIDELIMSVAKLVKLSQ